MDKVEQEGSRGSKRGETDGEEEEVEDGGGQCYRQKILIGGYRWICCVQRVQRNF